MTPTTLNHLVKSIMNVQNKIYQIDDICLKNIHSISMEELLKEYTSCTYNNFPIKSDSGKLKFCRDFFGYIYSINIKGVDSIRDTALDIVCKELVRPLEEIEPLVIKIALNYIEIIRGELSRRKL